jgi:hypothetical protein
MHTFVQIQINNYHDLNVSPIDSEAAMHWTCQKDKSTSILISECSVHAAHRYRPNSELQLYSFSSNISASSFLRSCSQVLSAISTSASRVVTPSLPVDYAMELLEPKCSPTPLSSQPLGIFVLPQTKMPVSPSSWVNR